MATFTPAANLDDVLAKVTTRGRGQLAARIAGEAAASSPVESGAFAGSIAARTSGTHAAVIATDPAATFIEYGTEDTPAHGTISNAARRYGRLRGPGARR